jgi:hypothetical protein
VFNCPMTQCFSRHLTNFGDYFCFGSYFSQKYFHLCLVADNTTSIVDSVSRYTVLQQFRIWWLLWQHARTSVYSAQCNEGCL